MRWYNFGNGKWVFIDWLGIEPGYGTHDDPKESSGYCVPYGIGLKTHSPDVEPEFCIPLDQPWETGIGAYAVFLKDGGIFRCWYPYRDDIIGYAESDDGIHWRKPSLGLHEFDGSKENNMLDFGSHGLGLFIDPTAESEERYKMVGCLWTETERLLTGAVSPDGMHWTPLTVPLLHTHADTQNICLYDEQISQYVLYTRQSDGFMQRRGINRSVSDDFRCFPPTQPVLECNPLDPPDWDFYCNGYSKWPDAPAAHLMRISMYKHTPDIVDVHLAVSRDGVIWHRPQGQEPWISRGPSYPKPYSSLYACSGLLETGPGEWSTYLAASHGAHNEPAGKRQPSGILRARMRKDGFMSLSSEGHGEVWTIPFPLACDTIRLNVETRHSGFVRAEVLLSEGAGTGAVRTANTNIPEYSLKDCVPMSGDHIDVPLAWKNGPELGKLRGKTVRLHIEMYQADLYSITFAKHHTQGCYGQCDATVMEQSIPLTDMD